METASSATARRANIAAFKQRTSAALANRQTELRAADDKRHAEALIAQQVAANRAITLANVERLLALSYVEGL